MPKERPARNAFDALVVLAVLIASVWVVPTGFAGRARAEAKPAQSATATRTPAASATTAPSVTPVSTPTPGRPQGPVAAVVDLGGCAKGVACGAGSLWAASSDGRLLRINPASNTVAAEIPVDPDGSGPAGVAVGAGAVWVPVAMPASLWRIDPARNRVVDKIPLGGTGLNGTVSVSATDGAVWVGSEDPGGGRGAGLLTRVDPAHNRVAARIHLPGVPTSVATSPQTASAPSGVWVATVSDGVLAIDARRNQVVRTLAAASSLGYTQTVAAGAGAVWLADPFGQRVLRVDPATASVTARVATGAVTGLMVDSGGIVWAVTPDGILRIDPRHREGQSQATVTTAVLAADLDGVLWLASGGGALWAGRTASVAHIDPHRLHP